MALPARRAWEPVGHDFTYARASIWVQGKAQERAVVRATISALATPPCAQSEARPAGCGQKARLPRCSSLIWNDQTALLAPCIRAFWPQPMRETKSDRPLGRVLRHAVAERPVFLLHLDQADEHVLDANTQFSVEPLCQGLVEGFLDFDRAAFVQRDLNDHD